MVIYTINSTKIQLEANQLVFFVLYAFILLEQKLKHTLRRMFKVSITSVMPIQTEAHAPSDFECNFPPKKVSDNYGA